MALALVFGMPWVLSAGLGVYSMMFAIETQLQPESILVGLTPDFGRDAA